MAKLGDSSTAQLILSELQNQSGGFGDESLTSVPLGIYLRQDPSMLSEILREVTDTIERAPDSSHRLLPLLGALHYSHDLQIGELLAGCLTIPERNKESYANVVLHAAIRWLPQYTMAIAHMPFSAQQQRTFAAISRQTALFVDAHNRGELDNLHTFYDPGILLSLLFWFSNPAHHGIVQQSVRKRFQEGGSVITDNHFEHAYLMYRAQYGDLPEMAQYIHPA